MTKGVALFSISLFVLSKTTSKFANKLRRVGNMVLRSEISEEIVGTTA